MKLSSLTLERILLVGIFFLTVVCIVFLVQYGKKVLGGTEGFQTMSLVTAQRTYPQPTYTRATYAITQQAQDKYTRDTPARRIYDRSVYTRATRDPDETNGNRLNFVAGRGRSFVGRIRISTTYNKQIINISRIQVLDQFGTNITSRLSVSASDSHEGAVASNTIKTDTGLMRHNDIYHSSDRLSSAWIEWTFTNITTPLYISRITIWNRFDWKDRLNGARLTVTAQDGTTNLLTATLTSADQQTFTNFNYTCPADHTYDGGAICRKICASGETTSGITCIQPCSTGDVLGGDGRCYAPCAAGYANNTTNTSATCIRVCAAGETITDTTCFKPCPAGFNLEGGNGGQCVKPCNGTDRRDGSTCFTACAAGETTEATICRRPCNTGDTLSGATCLIPCPSTTRLIDGRCYPTDLSTYITAYAKGNLINAQQNLNIALPNKNSFTNGIQLQARTNTTSENNDNSEFTWVYTEQGRLVNALTRKCLDNLGGNRTNGSAIGQWDCDGWGVNNRWFLDAAGALRLWDDQTKCANVGAATANTPLTINDCLTTVDNPFAEASVQRRFTFPDFALVGASPPTGALPAPIALGVVVLGTDDSIYYAEEGAAALTASSWTKVNGSLRTASLSDGHIYGVNSFNDTYATSPNTNIRVGNYNLIPPPTGTSMRIVSRSGKLAAGVTRTNQIFINTKNVQYEGNWTRITGELTTISISGTQVIGVGADFRLYYIADITKCNSTSCGWIGIQGNLGGRRMMYADIDENRVMAIDSRGKIFVADTGLTTGNPNWYQMRTAAALHGSMKNGRIYVRGTDNRLYYTNDYRSDRWTQIPLPTGVSILQVAAGTRAPAPAYCFNNSVRLATMNSVPAYIYTRAECDAIGKAAAIETTYKYGTGECLLKDAANTSVSKQCARLMQDSKEVSVQDLERVWDVPETAQEQKCWFDPIAYATKYKLNLNDIGVIRDHFVKNGIDAGYSPCGDDNPSCRWDPDAYLNFNPDVAKLKVVAKDHYKSSGLDEGRYFCNKTGFIPLLDNLKMTVQRTIVAMPSDLQTACKATSYTGGLGNKVNQYICPDRAKAEKLIAGPGSGDTAYLGEYDTVCYTNDASSKTYFCKSIQEDRNGYDYTTTMIDDYDTTCESLIQNYTDLSNNVTNLITMNGGLADGRTNLNGARTALQNISNTLKCDTTAQKETPACVAVTNGIRAIESKYSTLDGSFQSLDPAVTRALDSRTLIRDVITKFQCKL